MLQLLLFYLPGNTFSGVAERKLPLILQATRLVWARIRAFWTFVRTVNKEGAEYRKRDSTMIVDLSETRLIVFPVHLECYDRHALILIVAFGTLGSPFGSVLRSVRSSVRPLFGKIEIFKIRFFSIPGRFGSRKNLSLKRTSSKFSTSTRKSALPGHPADILTFANRPCQMTGKASLPGPDFEIFQKIEIFKIRFFFDFGIFGRRMNCRGLDSKWGIYPTEQNAMPIRRMKKC